MKKITAILLAVTLILALAACGSTAGTSQGSSGVNSDTSVSQDNRTGTDQAGAVSTGAAAWSAQGTEQEKSGGLGINPAGGVENDAAASGDIDAAGTETVSDSTAVPGTESAVQTVEDNSDISAASSTAGNAAQAATDVSAAATGNAAQAGTDASAAATGETAIAAAATEDKVSPEQLLRAVKGSYDELFTVICDVKYDQIWLDRCEAIVGNEKAPECVEMLKNVYTGTVYGEEAEKAYEDDPDQRRFDCYFHEGVERIIFDGNEITGLDEDGEEIFSHEYSYLKDLENQGTVNGYVYETSDKHAGEFKYFALLENTPDKDYHIEFRYGEDLDDLNRLTAGDYAYWLAAGITADTDEQTIEKVIRLFAEQQLMSMAPEGGTIEIGTARGLAQFARNVSDGSKNGYEDTTIKLTDDIDCSGIDWVPIGLADMDDMTDMSCMFRGTFNGKGHTISNITFTSTEPVFGAGLFGMNLGTVKHLTVENVNISCTDTNSMAVGGVVGYNMDGDIHDVMLTGDNSITGSAAVGGIAGGSTGKVHDCNVDGTQINVTGDNQFTDGRIILSDMAQCGGLVIGECMGGSVDECNAKGTVTAKGNEPVGLGGIAGCLEMIDSVTNCTADVTIVTEKGGHAIGGLCGYAGTHSNGRIAEEAEGIVTTQYPGIIDTCNVTVNMNVPGATHVGGLVGTGLYYYGEETAFKITNSSVKGEINGAVTPGAVTGQAANSRIESCVTDVKYDGKELEDQTGTANNMVESAMTAESGRE